jgi:DNA replication and repair protein RecF
MWVRSLAVEDFRSYEKADVEWEPGAVVLCGPNGRGKTNLVEAVGYAAGLTSHRVSTDAALVRVGQDRAVVRLGVVVAGRDITIDLQINPGRANQVRVNGAPLPRSRDVLGTFRCVTFAPEDLRLAKGEPVDRRRFLDGLIVQAAPRYAAVRADFDKALKQRNALLRAGTGMAKADFAASLQVWNDRYLPAAAELTWGRINAVRRLSEPMTAAYRAISPVPDTCAIEYLSATPGLAEATSVAELSELLAAAMAERQAEELRRGSTAVGPHRDDLAIRLNDMPARTHASHGESWSLALGLRLASFAVLSDIGQEPPVLILDDVFAELDQQRRSRLVTAIASAEQVLVTAAVETDVPAELVGQHWNVDQDGTSQVQPRD